MMITLSFALQIGRPGRQNNWMREANDENTLPDAVCAVRWQRKKPEAMVGRQRRAQA